MPPVEASYRRGVPVDHSGGMLLFCIFLNSLSSHRYAQYSTNSAYRRRRSAASTNPSCSCQIRTGIGSVRTTKTTALRDVLATIPERTTSSVGDFSAHAIASRTTLSGISFSLSSFSFGQNSLRFPNRLSCLLRARGTVKLVEDMRWTFAQESAHIPQ